MVGQQKSTSLCFLHEHELRRLRKRRASLANLDCSSYQVSDFYRAAKPKQALICQAVEEDSSMKQLPVQHTKEDPDVTAFLALLDETGDDLTNDGETSKDQADDQTSMNLHDDQIDTTTIDDNEDFSAACEDPDITAFMTDDDGADEFLIQDGESKDPDVTAFLASQDEDFFGLGKHFQIWLPIINFFLYLFRYFRFFVSKLRYRPLCRLLSGLILIER